MTTPPSHTNSTEQLIVPGWYGLVIIGLTSYLRHHPRLRHLMVVLGLIALMASGLLFLTPHPYVLFIVSTPLVVFWIGALMASSEFTFSLPPVRPETIERVEVERRVAESPSTASARDLLELDAKKLSEYYVINQVQARSGFRWAICVMLFGVVTILAGVWIFYFRGTPNFHLTALSVVAGIVMDLVSATFLYLNNTTQKLSLKYYDRLVRTQQVLISIRLAETHESSDARSRARNKVIDHLLTSSAQSDGGELEILPPRRLRSVRVEAAKE